MDDIAELRSSDMYRIVTPVELVAEMRAAAVPFHVFHPMYGGIPPDVARTTLKLFEHAVLPAFAGTL